MAKSFVEGMFYRLVDSKGFINNLACNAPLNTDIVDFIMSFGNKFQVRISQAEGSIKILGGEIGLVSMQSMVRELNQHEAKYFEEIVDDEVPLKEPNVPYSYSEVEIKDTLKVALEDDAFFAAVKMLSASDAAHVLSLKFGNRV